MSCVANEVIQHIQMINIVAQDFFLKHKRNYHNIFFKKSNRLNHMKKLTNEFIWLKTLLKDLRIESPGTMVLCQSNNHSQFTLHPT